MLIDRILEHARREPRAIALVHNGVERTYAEFAAWIARDRRAFREAGVAPGGVAAICISRLDDAWAAAIAMRSLGVTTVAVGDEVDIAALGLPGIACVVMLGAQPHPRAEDLAARNGWKVVRVAGFPGSGIGAPSLDALDAIADTPSAGHILLTSGTTGDPKKVLWEPLAEQAAVPALAKTYGIDAASVVYVGAFPIWTAGGHRWPAFAWHSGGTVVFEQSQQMHAPFASRRMTHAFATPATLAIVLHAPEGAFPRQEGMRLLVTAGALPKALAALAKDRLTREVYTLFASTEASVVTMTLAQEPEDLFWHRVLPSRVVQVVDEDDRVVPVGTAGLVRVAPPAGIAGYLGEDEGDRAFFREGFFYPGDIGLFREDGRLSLQGRSTDVINILGAKIATGPIERALQDRLGADGVCLFSLQREGTDEELHVTIESGRPVDRAILEAFAREELRTYPRAHFHVFAKLPRNAMGKVQRLALRKLLLERLGSARG